MSQGQYGLDHTNGKYVLFLDSDDFIKEIEISNSGEVFLNPDIDLILEYAYKKNISIYIDNGTNFNSVREEAIENLVKYGVKRITFSIDGASQDVYSMYRRNGNFDRVIENIKKLNFYKDKYGSNNLNLKRQYILMDHNECDIEKANKMASELNIELFFKKDWHNLYKPKDNKKIFKLTGLDYSNKSIMSKYGDDDFICRQMIYNPQINFDGRLLGCCAIYKNDWKMNAFDDGLVNCLNSDYYRNGVYRLLGGGDLTKNGDLCCTCDDYKKIFEDKNFINI